MAERNLTYEEARGELERRSDFSPDQIEIIMTSASPDAVRYMHRICDDLSKITDRSREGLRKYFGFYEAIN